MIMENFQMTMQIRLEKRICCNDKVDFAPLCKILYEAAKRSCQINSPCAKWSKIMQNHDFDAKHQICEFGSF